MPSCGVRLSVTFVYSVETREHIFKLKVFSPSDSQHLIFATPNVTSIFRQNAPPPRIEGVGKKSRFLTNIWLHRVLSTVRPPSVIHTAAPESGKLVTLIADKRRHLLFAGDGRRRVKHQRYTADNRTEFTSSSAVA